MTILDISEIKLKSDNASTHDKFNFSKDPNFTIEIGRRWFLRTQTKTIEYLKTICANWKATLMLQWTHDTSFNFHLLCKQCEVVLLFVIHADSGFFCHLQSLRCIRRCYQVPTDNSVFSIAYHFSMLLSALKLKYKHRKSSRTKICGVGW